MVTGNGEGSDWRHVEWLRETRARQEVCEHDWVELKGEELADQLRLNAIRDDVRVVGVAECRCCLVMRYVTLIMAGPR